MKPLAGAMALKNLLLERSGKDDKSARGMIHAGSDEEGMFAGIFP
jgi:hypothetical protein